MKNEDWYFCYVDGLGAPYAKHRSIDKAIAEANRLSGLELGKWQRII